jgi:hypothetical protein
MDPSERLAHLLAAYGPVHGPPSCAAAGAAGGAPGLGLIVAAQPSSDGGGDAGTGTSLAALAAWGAGLGPQPALPSACPASDSGTAAAVAGLAPACQGLGAATAAAAISSVFASLALSSPLAGCSIAMAPPPAAAAGSLGHQGAGLQQPPLPLQLQLQPPAAGAAAVSMQRARAELEQQQLSVMRECVELEKRRAQLNLWLAQLAHDEAAAAATAPLKPLLSPSPLSTACSAGSTSGWASSSGGGLESSMVSDPVMFPASAALNSAMTRLTWRHLPE